jgi:hypothetical protein
MVVAVISLGKTKSLPTGGKIMETLVLEEGGEVKPMDRRLGLKSGIYMEVMSDEANPGKIVLLAFAQVDQCDNLFYLYLFLSVCVRARERG